VAGGDFLSAPREFAARQSFQKQWRDQPVTEQGDFFGFGIHREDLPEQKHRAEASPVPCKSCVGDLRGRRRRAECGKMAVRSEKRWPAQQVHSQIGKQEMVGSDPADGLQHAQRARDEVRGRWRRG